MSDRSELEAEFAWSLGNSGVPITTGQFDMLLAHPVYGKELRERREREQLIATCQLALSELWATYMKRIHE
jgi:hypothetical protein